MRKRVFWEFGFYSCNGDGVGVLGLGLGRWVNRSWIWRERRGLVGMVLEMGEGVWPCLGELFLFLKFVGHLLYLNKDSF